MRANDHCILDQARRKQLNPQHISSTPILCEYLALNRLD